MKIFHGLGSVVRIACFKPLVKAGCLVQNILCNCAVLQAMKTDGRDTLAEFGRSSTCHFFGSRLPNSPGNIDIRRGDIFYVNLQFYIISNMKYTEMGTNIYYYTLFAT